MTVAVSAGNGMVRATPTGGNAQHFNVRSDASENVTIASNASGSTVYDFIYIVLAAATLNNPNVTGTDAMTFTVQRSTTQYVDSNSAPANSELIAEVTVVNGAASIANASITDRRRKANIFSNSWQDFNEVPVYVSATTMTVSAGLAATLFVGDKLLLRQAGSDKYFYITGISGTTITIFGGTDYTLANAVIGKAQFSKAANPTGFPGYFNSTNAGGGGGSLNVSLQGREMKMWGLTAQSGNITTGTSGTLAITFPLTFATAPSLTGTTSNNTGSGATPLFHSTDVTTTAAAGLSIQNTSAGTVTAKITWIAVGTI